MSKKNTIDQLKQADLRGRGGAGFPTGLKWEMVKQFSAKKKYIVCNGSEGDPSIAKDGFILAHYPEQVINGIKIALQTIDHSSAYLYLRTDYYQKYKTKLKKVIGRSPITLFKEIGGYLSGEETTLIETIEGNRQEPRMRPPYPPQSGLWNCPTLINNLETFYCVNQIATQQYQRTRFYTLSGDLLNPGVYELPINWSVKRILQETNNLLSLRSKFFIQIGSGVSGEIIKSTELNRQVNGSGAIVVYKTKKHKPISLMRYWAKFFLDTNCGKCAPCREGIYRLNKLLCGNRINRRLLDDLLFVLEQTSFCPLGKSVTVPFRSLLDKIY
ncbi:MAG: hypothetical protein KAS12_01045 [Candidatus Aenigmarchaeota archaeon]|nr:hypothetical protein [Candidatus Aenigmarchaeota archaeon]